MSTQNAKPIFSMQTNSVKIDLNAKTSFITNITLRSSCLLNILLPYYQGVKTGSYTDFSHSLHGFACDLDIFQVTKLHAKKLVRMQQN